jgi:hypothetical protein
MNWATSKLTFVSTRFRCTAEIQFVPLQTVILPPAIQKPRSKAIFVRFSAAANNDLVKRRKNKAKEVIKLNEIKVEDFAEFEEIVQARVDARLAEKALADAEALKKAAPQNPPLEPEGKNVIKEYDPISLPKDSKFKIGDQIIKHGGARAKEEIVELVHGPIIDKKTRERDTTKGIGIDEFKRLYTYTEPTE